MSKSEFSASHFGFHSVLATATSQGLTLLCIASLSWSLNTTLVFAQEENTNSSTKNDDESAAEAERIEAEAVNEEAAEALTCLLCNEFGVFYQTTHQDFKQDNFAVSDWRENQLRATGQVLFEPGWLLSGSILGSRSELNLADFNSNPVFSFDTFGAEVTASSVWLKSPRLQIASGLAYLYYHYTPDNLDQSNQTIPYTNSALDNEYTSQGPGLYSIAAFKVFDKLTLLANISLYPYLFNGIKKGGAIPYSGLGRGQVQLRYQIVKGFLVSAFADQDLWFGTYSQANTTLGIGLTLVPDQISDQ